LEWLPLHRSCWSDLVAAGSQAQPACAVPTNDDNVGFSTFNRAHFGQEQFGLVVVEGWLNACENAEAVTDVSATGKAILVHAAARVQIRVLEQQNPASEWVVQAQSDSVNSSGAFYIQASTPEDGNLGEPDTYRVRVLIRWTDNTTSFQEYTPSRIASSDLVPTPGPGAPARPWWRLRRPTTPRGGSAGAGGGHRLGHRPNWDQSGDGLGRRGPWHCSIRRPGPGGQRRRRGGTWRRSPRPIG
jgi:hypothetical protein